MKSKITEINIERSYRDLLEYFARFDFDYFVFTITATVVCFFGFMMDSPSIIIGAMVLSPLLYPVIAIATSYFFRDWKVFVQSAGLLFVGLFVVFFISYIMGALLEVDMQGSEIMERVMANVFVYFMVAFVSGFAGMFCFLWPKALEAMTGVAISIALLPPLVIMGISASENLDIFIKTFIIVIVNSIGIILGALLVLFLIRLTRKVISS